MKASIISLLGAAAAVTAQNSSVPWTTSTVYATSIYTVTSCAETVTDCPARLGAVTTEIVSLYTTWCPVAVEATTTAAAASTWVEVSESTWTEVSASTWTEASKPWVTSVWTGAETVKWTSTWTEVATSKAAGATTWTKPAEVITPAPSASSTPWKYPAKNSTTTSSVVAFTGAASAQKVGSLLMAAGLAVAFL